MAVNYLQTDDFVGTPPLNVAGDTTSRIKPGTIVNGVDFSTADFGTAEFLYVKFTGTVAAGDLCIVDRQAKTATQTGTVATKGNLGIAMGAQTTGCFGYVMLRGVHDAANVLTGTTLQAGVGQAYVSALTAARITSIVTANYIIDGIAVKVSGASNVGTVELYYPVCSGR